MNVLFEIEPLKGTSMSQNQAFCFQAIPDLFHTASEQFIKLLDRDGNKFLQFYWDEAGKRQKLSGKVVPYGLNYEFIKFKSGRLVILIKLPFPVQPGDAHYMALLYRPDRVMLFGFLPDITKVLLMVESETGGSRSLVEITRKLETICLQENIQPSREEFLNLILQEMDH